MQVAFHLPRDIADYAVTLSGGVGELVYAHLQGRPWPPTTRFGDLGIDLARRLVERSPWAAQFRGFRADIGRAGHRVRPAATQHRGLRQHVVSSATRSCCRWPTCRLLGTHLARNDPTRSSTICWVSCAAVPRRRAFRDGCRRTTASAVRTLGATYRTSMLASPRFSCRASSCIVGVGESRQGTGTLRHRSGAQLPLNLIVIDEIAVPRRPICTDRPAARPGRAGIVLWTARIDGRSEHFATRRGKLR